MIAANYSIVAIVVGASVKDFALFRDHHTEDHRAQDRKTHQVLRANRSETLTRTEFALLEKLIRNAGTTVPRDALVEAGWGVGASVNDSTLYVFIRALRNKIAVNDEPQLLHTARGVGYSLRSLPH